MPWCDCGAVLGRGRPAITGEVLICIAQAEAGTATILAFLQRRARSKGQNQGLQIVLKEVWLPAPLGQEASPQT